jgi:hypothetical protein
MSEQRVSDETVAELAVEIPDPVCRVCGGEMVIGRMGGGEPTSWSCAAAVAEWQADGYSSRSEAWGHLRASSYNERRDYTTVNLAFDLQSARARIAALEAVLGFYADSHNYSWGAPGIWSCNSLGDEDHVWDEGERARAALATTTEQDSAQVSGEGE